MAATGTVTYSATIIGNQPITIPGYQLSLSKSGSFPSSTDYTISTVVVERSFRNASTYGFQIWTGANKTGVQLSQTIDAQTGGGKASTTTISSTYLNNIKAQLKSGTETVYLCGVNGQSGELKSGGIFKITITWKESASAATLALGATSVACGSNLSYTCSGMSSSYSYSLTMTLRDGEWTYTPSASGSIAIGTAQAAEIPNAKSATATLVLTTKNGSKTIGTSSKSVKITVPEESPYLPSVSRVTITPQKTVTVDEVTYILQNHSYANINVTASAGSGASVKTIKVEGQNLSASVSGSSFDKNTKTFTANGSFTYTITVTDSRDRTYTQTTSAINVTEYTKPTCRNLNARRCTSDGDIVATGTNVVVQGTPVFTDLASNYLKVKVEVKQDNETYEEFYDDKFVNGWIVKNGSSVFTFDAGNRYMIKFTFYDKFTSSTPIEIVISTAYVLMRWDPANNAFSYGGYPTGKNRVEIADTWGLYHGGLDVFWTGAPAPVLWTMEVDNSNTMWSSGQADFAHDIADWLVIGVVLDTNATGILMNNGAGVFRGVCHGIVSNDGLRVYGLKITRDSETKATITAFEKMNIKTSGITAYGSPCGIIKIYGIKHI